MPNTTRGVGLFTAQNIVAAIRAIPDSDGTYRDVASKARAVRRLLPSPHLVELGSATAGLILKPANRPPPTPDSPNCTET